MLFYNFGRDFLLDHTKWEPLLKEDPSLKTLISTLNLLLLADNIDKKADNIDKKPLKDVIIILSLYDYDYDYY